MHAVNDYRKVIDMAEAQFWSEYRVWKVHDHYLTMFISEYERIKKIPENKRSDLDLYRFWNLPSWITNRAKEVNSAMNRCLFFHNAIKDLENIMKQNLSNISSE